MRTKFWSENLKGRDHLEDPGIDGRITVECMWGSRVGKCGLDSCDSGQGPIEGCCEHGNELSGSLNGGDFVDQLSDIVSEGLLSMWLVGWLVGWLGKAA
jgi:hypothetical protein